MNLLRRIHWWYLRTFRDWAEQPFNPTLYEGAFGKTLSPEGRKEVRKGMRQTGPTSCPSSPRTAKVWIDGEELPGVSGFELKAPSGELIDWSPNPEEERALVDSLKHAPMTFEIPASVTIHEGDVLGFTFPGGKTYPFRVGEIRSTPEGWEMDMRAVEEEGDA